jgi:hypothetical protein
LCIGDERTRAKRGRIFRHISLKLPSLFIGDIFVRYSTSISISIIPLALSKMRSFYLPQKKEKVRRGATRVILEVAGRPR